ncbi:MAG: 4Fe-4S dicluster domain-containing protein [Deltaproteobacteria bacterium]|nr:MAG: 4Fe-4S dicluster domain-containing protein [Deltaproteobacteria bacterium]
MKISGRKKYAMIIDSSKCIDCKACMIACKVENRIPAGFWRNWIRHFDDIDEHRWYFQPGQCMQCDDPSCVAACPVGATFKGEDGIVVIDPLKCVGCGNCVTACPYGARYRNPDKHIADKCDFCRHRLARGQSPACVETCPTKARIFGDLSDPASRVSRIVEKQDLVQIVDPLVNTEPNIFYVKGTLPLGWAKEPTLPGGVHMPRDFWKEA